MKHSIPLLDYERIKSTEHDKEGHYAIKLDNFYHLDQAGNHTTCRVYIKDKLTNKVYKRTGDGRQIGNFHPIWINWKGNKIQIESLLWEV